MSTVKARGKVKDNSEKIDGDNARFWSEPCGIAAFDRFKDPVSKQIDFDSYDKWFWETYPYLLSYLNELDLEGRSVLEVGIGMGTVSRYLVARSASLTCLDIAPGAINFVKSSIGKSKQTNFVCESILNHNFKKKFDVVIAIGSLHHTGDLEKSLMKVEDLTNADGTLLIMVYFAFNSRRVFGHPLRSFKEIWLTRRSGSRKQLIFEEKDEILRASIDANRSGDAAPYTAFSSRKLFSNRPSLNYAVQLENFHAIPFLHRFINRSLTLKWFSKYFGCDIYAKGRKN